MTVYPWTIQVRDSTLALVGELDDYQKLDMVLKFNDVSTWQLQIDRRNRLAAALATDGAGIVVTRNGATILSGYWTEQEHVKDKDTNTLTFSGVDDTVWLRRRRAHPQPGSTAPPYSTTAEDYRVAVASTVMRDYVGINVGVTAIAARKIAAVLRDPDISYGATVSGRGRWQSLLTLVQEMATAGAVNGLPVGFKIVQEGSVLRYKNFAPVDRTATAIFSEGFGNLSSFTYKRVAPETNYAYVGGSGTGTARTIYEKPDSDSIAVWGRIEGDFVDAASAANSTELDQAGAKALIDSGVKTSLSVTPIDTATLAFGVHYGLGDKVTAILDVLGPDGEGQIGDSVQDVLRECQVSLTPNSSTVTPSVGTQDASLNLLRMIKVLVSQGKRIVNLERR